MKKQIKFAFIGMGVFMLTCIALVGLGVAIDATGLAPTDTPGFTLTETSLSTTAPEPTDTPKPSDTPLPSKTPTITPTTAATLGPVDVYLEELAPSMVRMSNCMYQFSELTLDAGNDPALVFERYWNVRVDMALSCVVDESEKVSQMDAPQELANVHYYLRLMHQEFVQAHDKFIQGLENMDVNLIEQATGHIDQANEYINRAEAEIEKVTDE